MLFFYINYGKKIISVVGTVRVNMWYEIVLMYTNTNLKNTMEEVSPVA